MLLHPRFISRLNYGVRSIVNSNQNLVYKNVTKSWIPAQLQPSQHRTIHQTNQLRSDEDDYYSILRVNHNATPDEIRAAYSRLSQENSPMRLENMVESAKNLHRINRAFNVLNDRERRKMYDLNIGAAEQKRWKLYEEYQQSAEDFANEREAAFKTDQTKNQSESRFQQNKPDFDVSEAKARIFKEDVDETEFDLEEKKGEKNAMIFLGCCFIMICLSQIYRYFQDKAYVKMVNKYAEWRTNNLK